MAERYEKLARDYFATWNKHDGEAVGKLFTQEGTLRDWDISVSGAAAVGEANGNIFKAVPNINITVEKISVDVGNAVATCEILVHVNDEAKTVLKVSNAEVSAAETLGTRTTGQARRAEPTA